MYGSIHIDINKTIELELVTYIPIPTIVDNKVILITGTNLLRLTNERNVTAEEHFT
jgi:hypothetical protein